MRRELLLERISPDLLAELQLVRGSYEAVDEAIGYDRAYAAFFGVMNAEQKLRYITRFEIEGIKINRLRARIWRLCDTFDLSEEQVLDRLAMDSHLKHAYWQQMRYEYFRKPERTKTTQHHIIPKSRGGTKRRRNNIEEELHSQLHTIFGVMLSDEKLEMIRWYERPNQQIISDQRIPYRFHPNERLLLKNIRAGVMQTYFTLRLSEENESRAARSYAA